MNRPPPIQALPSSGTPTGGVMRTLASLVSIIVVAVIVPVTVSPGEIGASEPTSLQVAEGPNSITIRGGGQPLLEYRTTASPLKPYIRELFTPGGVQILRDSPLDHKHHHGLMFAVEVDGVDFWTEEPTCGRQVPRARAETTSSAGTSKSQVALAQHLDWTSPDGAILLGEERTITAHVGPEVPATLVTWRSRLHPPAGKTSVTLGGSHYFGLGMRFVEPMDQEGEFTNSDGREGPIVRGSERLTPARWCAYLSGVDGKPVTVALFDHPQNARAAYFFTMRPFAYLAATLNLWRQPMEIKAGAPLDLCYGIAVWDGRVESGQVEMLYQRWVELSR